MDKKRLAKLLSSEGLVSGKTSGMGYYPRDLLERMSRFASDLEKSAFAARAAGRTFSNLVQKYGNHPVANPFPPGSSLTVKEYFDNGGDLEDFLIDNMPEPMMKEWKRSATDAMLLGGFSGDEWGDDDRLEELQKVISGLRYLED